MKAAPCFAAVAVIGAAIVAISGCGSTGPAPVASSIPVPAPATPPAKWLYVDHNGTFYQYSLPLAANTKPVRTLTEWPGLGLAPEIAVAPNGDVALASPHAIRIFAPPILSFDPKDVKLAIRLTPAITEIGAAGADLVDMEYDPNGNLWLLNDLGAEISQLAAPLSKGEPAALTLGFGAPGSKTAGYASLNQARFDVNATLYVYASSATRSRLFKLSFPYAKQPSSLGIDVAQADFVDSSQYLPTNGNPADLLLGQYTGPLHSPKPGSPPSPPVDEMSQFSQPFNPQKGLFPDDVTDTVAGALIADPPRERFYTLRLDDGELDVYGLPLRGGAEPVIGLPCLAGAANCNNVGEHAFLAP
ncbi:MAG TPA: hypothetical protein VGX91_00490 [Candidatus Cybelea sp.]|jgi:hypothetical protein|nr:hypothetical protein [Candidatus Cybelea sp.]